MECVDQSEARITWGGTSTQTGSMRPHRGSDQADQPRHAVPEHVQDAGLLT